ncbi:uncharacterized protein LOC131157470 [Malania oleifera]|uniref:uncharacterized protein LOC131157470 n=1 Tax=Malania oleifera TaxID=397392 RepID=UPI0025AE88B9|nr:uncharacterized protein LOC131157470 [Malania oleifera]XP_057967640.1 uncharacterized protein LOC131157470 [Malania oleifera]
MARSLSVSRTLTRLSHCSILTSNSPPPPSSLLFNLRRCSDHANADSFVALRQLEDAVHRVVARRSAPDWLPFVPGASYWVPPPPTPSSQALADLISKLDNTLTKERAKSLTTVRGWPSSSYFDEGASPHPVELELASNNKSHSEDEEG